MTPRSHSLRPFFSYFGGKWRFAKHYPTPAYRRIVEPFAGSAGYSLRYPAHDVVLIDADPLIVRTWRWLIRANPDDILRLPDIPEGGTLDDVRDVHPDARLLMGWWLNRATTRPCTRPSAWMRTGQHSGSFWGPRVRERIASQVDRISHWSVVQGSYEDAPSREATWFVDPPYVGQGHRYTHGSEGIDYERLAAWCRGRPGQVIVCEQKGADWLPFRPFRSTKTARKGRRSDEVVWLQGCPAEAPA